MTVAQEIYRKFWRKMAPGGEIDQILAGGQIEKRTALSDEEIERIKHNIEVQLVEYAQALNDAAKWNAARRAKQPQGFKIRRG